MKSNLRDRFISRAIVFTTLFSVTFGFSGIPSNAAGAKPKFDINCGSLLKSKDNNGDFLYFNPTVKVTYFGHPLTLIAYYGTKKGQSRTEQTKNVVNVTGSKSPSGKFTDYFDFSYKFLRYSKYSYGYFSMNLEAIDSQKRKTSFKCEFVGDFGFERATSANGNNVKPSPMPSPTPNNSNKSEPLNDLESLVFSYNTYSSGIGIAPLLRERSSGTYFLSSPVSEKTTALKKGNLASFTDYWQDKILGCPSNDCVQKTYFLGWGDESLSIMSVQDVKQPDGYSGAMYRKAVFGNTTETAYLLANFISPIEGLKSVIFRVDTRTMVKIPIFTSYCFVTNNQICNQGAQIYDFSINKQTGLIYISLEIGSNLVSSTSTTANNYLILSLPADSQQLTLKKVAEVAGKIAWEGKTDLLINDKDTSQRIDSITVVPKSTTFYYHRSPVGSYDKDNQICRYKAGLTECQYVAPFDYMSIISSVDEDRVIYSRGINSYYLYDFAKKLSYEIKNPYGVNLVRFG